MGYAYNDKRRQSLKLILGAGAGSMLGGCCTFGIYPGASIKPDDFPPLESIQPVLRPKPRNPIPHPYPRLDAHAHFFNASDVNVRDYLAKCVGHSVDSAAIRAFIDKLAIVAERIAYLAPTAQNEFVQLKQMATQRFNFAEGGADSALKKQADEQRRKIARALFEGMTRDNLDVEYEQLQGEHIAALARASGSSSLVKEAPPKFTYEEVLDAIDPERRRARESREANLVAHEAEAPAGILAFVGHMLNYRWMNLRDYGRFYTEEESAFGIDGVFGSLVDFDFWLNKLSRSSRADQMRLQSLLSLMSGGYMLPLISYNPWTDIREDDASLKLLKDAITDYGYVGVKIYPPVGYYPYGNEALPNLSKERRPPDIAALDKKLAAMFDWCAPRGIPVMAHTNESMGRDNDGDQFGGPEGWKKLLERYKDRLVQEVPVINAGHFGGAAANTGGKEWPEQFAGFSDAGNTAGQRFYGDLGYWEELMNCDGGNQKCATAKLRLKNALKHSGAATHIMYGSDWFMLSKVSGWENYPKLVLKNVGDLIPAENLFYRNAMTCFGLLPGGAQRERILARLALTPGGVPKWIKDAVN